VFVATNVLSRAEQEKYWVEWGKNADYA